MSSEQRVNLYALTDTITPWAVRAAATLGVADLVDAGKTSLADLATATGADPGALGRLLRYLVVRGVFTETAPGVYGSNDASAMLRSDHPSGQRPWLDVDGMAGRIEGTFSHLLDSIRTGGAAYPSRYGIDFWDDLAADPAKAKSFNALMATHASYFDQVVAGYDWSGVTEVADVGGGTGALLTAILSANPHLRGTVVDLPEVTKEAEARFTEAGLSDRARVAGGSIFEPLPAGKDVYVLSNVLHDFDDAGALKILRRCADAAGDNGRVVIVQILVAGQDDSYPDPQTLMFITQMDLRLLALMSGKARTWKEYQDLAVQAGLTITGTTVVPTGQTLLELRRA
jgi:predicted O-methyltransferase YrrM